MVLIKEYRIPLPLTVDEYRIAQLYMIAKKSRMESHSEESGVQILVNEPYTDGPGPSGAGQYTRKVYYIASHLPGWLKALIPKSALTVEEEAWNAYPYTKTRYTCSIVDKFSIEVETVYHNDGGHQENVFNLSKAELKQLESDLIDVVRDQQVGAADYSEAEDPRLFHSAKTGRGPLEDNWIHDYWEACKDKDTPLPDGKAIMCAYKLCKVEFRYWGMQSKIEKFIHDVALRKTMFHAHQQAWAWQDEWWGLTIEDVRAIEEETMAILQQKYAAAAAEGEEDEEEGRENGGVEAKVSEEEEDIGNHQLPNARVSPPPALSVARSSIAVSESTQSSSPRVRVSSDTNSDGSRSGISVKVCADDDGSTVALGSGGSPRPMQEWAGSSDSLQPDHLSNRRPSWARSISKNTLSSQSQVSWRMESIRRDSYSDDSEADNDEFFDCPEHLGGSSVALHKWSSLELLASEPPTPDHAPDSHHPLDHAPSPDFYHADHMHENAAAYVPGSPCLGGAGGSPAPHCPTAILVLVLHAGSVLDTPTECSSKGSDLATFRHAFESVVRQRYPELAGGGVAFRILPVHTVTAPALQILCSLSGNSGGDGWVPVGALPVIAEGTPEYQAAVQATGAGMQATYKDFTNSPEGVGFAGHVCIIGDCVAGLLLYDVLCQDLPGMSTQDEHGAGDVVERRGGGARESAGASPNPHSPGGGCLPLLDPKLAPKAYREACYLLESICHRSWSRKHLLPELRALVVRRLEYTITKANLRVLSL